MPLKKWFPTKIPCVIPVMSGWAESTRFGMMKFALVPAGISAAPFQHTITKPQFAESETLLHSSHEHAWAKQSKAGSSSS